jgi:hypothetical protein
MPLPFYLLPKSQFNHIVHLDNELKILNEKIGNMATKEDLFIFSLSPYNEVKTNIFLNPSLISKKEGE